MSVHGVYDLLGSLLIAAWLSLMLYVLVIHQTNHYFRCYPADKGIVKAAVSGVVVCDTLATVAACGSCYLLLVKDKFYLSAYLTGKSMTFREFNSLRLPTLFRPTPLSLIVNGISAAIVQCFMLNRYWVLTSRKSVIGAIGLTILLHVGSVAYVTALIIAFYNDPSRTRILTGVILWLTSGAVVDVSIAILLVVYYMSTDVELRSSRRLIRRLTTLALKTGLFTAVTAILSLAIFVSDYQTNVDLIFIYNISHVYSLTLLYNLNIRRKLIGIGQTINLGSEVVMPNFRSGVDTRGRSSTSEARAASEHTENRKITGKVFATRAA
ncbi:hypothetical protein D9758_009817 [Tetrapyrgos nigripes]|uniref:DUF6534 domain-containing protein n=1 Tax=Tetrapyrgos nigripes TaxID=182062 RepID=A0A8H5GN05_9AGAR|nr:hypothetical protein D9758_009817 [Tetrapyrgos nigripes]